MLKINIDWEYLLGIFGTLITVAYYANGRLTRLETNFDWITEAVRDLSIKTENLSAKAFDVSSPISLTATGEVRCQKILSSGGRSLSRDAREFFKKRRLNQHALTHQSIHASQTHGRLDARLCPSGILHASSRTFVKPIRDVLEAA